MLKKINMLVVLGLILSVVCYCGPVFATQYVNAGLDANDVTFIDVGGFHRWLIEDSHYNSLVTLGNFTNPWLSSSSVYRGTHSLALQVNATENAPNDRDKNIVAFVRNVDSFALTFGQARYFGFAMKLGGDEPDLFETPTNWELIFQAWQDNPTECPPLAITIDTNTNPSSPVNYKVKIRDESLIGNYSVDAGTTISQGTFARDTWYNVVFYMKPSYLGSGLPAQVSMWVDGVLKFNNYLNWGYKPQSLGGIPGMTDKISIQTGFYRRMQNTKQVMYLDQVKYGTTYAEADPSN